MDLDILTSAKNMEAAGIIWAVSQALKAEIGEFKDHPTVQRAIPLVPVVAGVLCGLFGLVEVSTDPHHLATTWENVKVGAMIAFGSMGLFKVGKTSVIGRGVERPDHPLPESAGKPDDPDGEQE